MCRLSLKYDGISEVDSAKFYLKNNGIENIEIIPYNDGWDPDRIESVYKEIREDGIDIIIASHPSSCALELLELVKNDKEPVIILSLLQLLINFLV